jgi:hypothetical protein
MDSIDITDLPFALVGPVTDNVTSVVDNSTNNMMYIYIGIVAFFVLIGIYIYKKYQNNKNEDLSENYNACSGGFCPLN